MVKCLFLIFFVLSMSGCVTSEFADIKQIAQSDTYVLSRQGDDSLILSKEVVKRAVAFCRSKDMFMVGVSKNYNTSFYQLKFRCLLAGDPELDDTDSLYKQEWHHKKLGGFGNIKY